VLTQKRRKLVEQVASLPPSERLKLLRALVRELKQLEAINEMGRDVKRRGLTEKDLVGIALEQS
jgi:hypothetical protein